MSFLTECKNCGKQVELDDGDPDELCYWCGKPALKKEEIMSKIMTSQAQMKELIPVPPRPIIPAGATLRQRIMLSHDYYEANRTAITKEWESLGKPHELKRWDITQGSLNGLLKRWHLISTVGKEVPVLGEKPHKEKSQPKGNRLVSLGTFTVEAASELPPLPAFNSNWDWMVQLRWLDTYRELAGRSKS